MKTYYWSPLLFLQLCLASHGLAQWEFVANFDQDGLANVVTTLHESSEVGPVLINDPLGAFGKTLFVDSGTGDEYFGFGHSFNVIHQDNKIVNGGRGTLYFNYMQDGPSNYFTFGMSDTPLTLEDGDNPIPASPSNFGDYEVMIRFDINGLHIRDEAQFFTTDWSPQNQVWYEIWMVINNGEADLSPDEFTVYIKGGEYTAQTLILVDGEATSRFRNGTEMDLSSIFLGTLSGQGNLLNEGDLWYIDNIYLDPSNANLTTPNFASIPEPLSISGISLILALLLFFKRYKLRIKC